jgi:hypothetical protein
MSTNSSIRDFIYLDTFRVRSLASQLDEGLAESRLIERGGKLETKKAISPESAGATTELKLTEERLLLDHIYNELERRIAPSSPVKNAAFDIAATPLIKVTGCVEVEDYKEFLTFLNNYNEIGKIISWSSFADDKKFGSIQQKQNALAKHAKDSGLYQDPILLNNLQTFMRLLAPDALNFVFDSTQDTGFLVRAVIDRAWLRYTESFLHGLYAGASTIPWTVVGIPTFAPSNESQRHEEYDANNSLLPDGTPNMALSYRNMLRHARFLSNTFFRTSGNELVILPLAVYREFEITIQAPT